MHSNFVIFYLLPFRCDIFIQRIYFYYWYSFLFCKISSFPNKHSPYHLTHSTTYGFQQYCPLLELQTSFQLLSIWKGARGCARQCFAFLFFFFCRKFSIRLMPSLLPLLAAASLNGFSFVVYFLGIFLRVLLGCSWY